MKEHYEDNQNMFEKVERRQKLWREFLEFEVNEADCSIATSPLCGHL